jgi:mono/diheme cytochrome c family protein
MLRRMMLLVATAAALAATTSIRAQDIGQQQKGHELAQQLCSECHAVRKDQTRSPNPNAPRFEIIAGVSGMSSAALHAALQTSHRSMPNILLDADQMTNIVAYILSLK